MLKMFLVILMDLNVGHIEVSTTAESWSDALRLATEHVRRKKEFGRRRFVYKGDCSAFIAYRGRAKKGAVKGVVWAKIGGRVVERDKLPEEVIVPATSTRPRAIAE